MTSNISDNRNTGHKVDHKPKHAGIAKNARSKIRTSANDKENASKSVHPSHVSSCDIRERLIHLLALKPFTMVELISRLKKEGISDHERRSITSILKDIASVSEIKFRLRSHIWDQVNENWHFYTEYEQNQSKRNKSFHLTPPYNSNAASSCVNQNQTSTLIPSPSLTQQLDKFKNENHLPFKKRRIFREVPRTATINSLNPESTHISCSYSNDISKHVVVGSNPVGNRPNSNPTHCAGHSTKRHSKHQVKDSTRSRNDLNKSDKDEKSKRQKHQQTQPQLDFPKKKERTHRKKRHHITEQFGEDLETPAKISNSDKREQDKGKPTDFNLQQQTQPQLDFPKKKERTHRKKRHHITEQFGEDLETPAKISNSDKREQDKGKPTDFNLQQQTQPQLDSPKKKERTHRKKRHNITEQFGEDLETPAKISNSDKRKQDKGKPTDFNLQQQTQPQLDFPKKKERTHRKKRHNITEQFGEDLETPTKISNSDRRKQDKGKPTDFNLQQQTQPKRDLPKKSDSLTKSMSRAIRNKQRMIEVFSEDSDQESDGD